MFNLKRSNQYNFPITQTLFSCVRDGLTIRGTEYRPKGDHLPIAIVSHGFMAFQDTVRHYALLLAGMGYAAYCFDFSGGCVMKGKSDGKTTDMSVLTEVEDLKAVISYASSRPYNNAEKITLMGCSQGGFVSAITASELDPAISKLILFYPALCIPDDARAGHMMFARFDPHHIPDTIQCGPMKLGRCYAEDVIDMDPYEEIKNFTGDVLIVHGEKDSIVHMRYAQEAYRTYLKAAKDKQLSRTVTFYVITNGQHGFSENHDQIAISYLRQFLS